jgi:uncharacterized membrane protein
MEYLHQVSFGIGVLGILVIVFGVASGFVRMLGAELKAARGGDVESDRRRLRHVLGYYLLLGLEFLIAADIIDTLMKPSAHDLIALGAIVLIRTVISYSLNTELTGQTCWPGSRDFRVPGREERLENRRNRQTGMSPLQS